MFDFDFWWSDILLGHYLLSLFVCVLAVIITYIVSKKYNLQTTFDGKIDPVISGEQNVNDDSDSDSATLSTPVIKKSPALAAEEVIQANMTDEQRKMEYEVRQKQLAQIYELMLKQSDKFGNISLSDVEEQMKLYQ